MVVTCQSITPIRVSIAFRYEEVKGNGCYGTYRFGAEKHSAQLEIVLSKVALSPNYALNIAFKKKKKKRVPKGP